MDTDSRRGRRTRWIRYRDVARMGEEIEYQVRGDAEPDGAAEQRVVGAELNNQQASRAAPTAVATECE